MQLFIVESFFMESGILHLSFIYIQIVNVIMFFHQPRWPLRFHNTTSYINTISLQGTTMPNPVPRENIAQRLEEIANKNNTSTNKMKTRREDAKANVQGTSNVTSKDVINATATTDTNIEAVIQFVVYHISYVIFPMIARWQDGGGVKSYVDHIHRCYVSYFAARKNSFDTYVLLAVDVIQAKLVKMGAASQKKFNTYVLIHRQIVEFQVLYCNNM